MAYEHDEFPVGFDFAGAMKSKPKSELKEFRVNILYYPGLTKSVTVMARYHEEAEREGCFIADVPYELAQHIVTWEETTTHGPSFKK